MLDHFLLKRHFETIFVSVKVEIVVRLNQLFPMVIWQEDYDCGKKMMLIHQDVMIVEEFCCRVSSLVTLEVHYYYNAFVCRWKTKHAVVSLTALILVV